MGKASIGLQIYTIRDVAEKDYAGALRIASEIGYKGVQMVATSAFTSAELKTLLDELQLQCPSAHIGWQALLDSFDQTASYWTEVGAKYLCVSGLPEGNREKEDDWRKAAEVFNRIGEKCAEAGLTFCYHNHSFEFVRFSGKYALDLLYELTDPEFLKAEIDTYWVKHGGEDPAEYLRRYSGRCPLVHLKDMADDPERSFTEVGTGILDWENIFDAIEVGAVEWCFVEQDVCPRGSVESARLSFQNLRKWGKA